MTFTPWTARGMAAAGGLLLAGAFPPLNCWPLALVGLVPVLWVVWARSGLRKKGSRPEEGRHAVAPDLVENTGGQHVDPPQAGAIPQDGVGGIAGGKEMPQDRDGLVTADGKETRAPFWPCFRLGWIFGFFFFTATLWWIEHVTWPGMLALTAYLALYPAVALGVAGWLGMKSGDGWKTAAGRVLLLAGVWTGLAVPLFDRSSARMLAAGIGVTGLSCFVFLFSGTVAAILFQHGKKSGRLLLRWSALWVMAELAAGFLERVVPPFEPAFYHAALIQPNVTMEEKRSPDPEEQRQRYFDLEKHTAQAFLANEERGFDLVVWPESAVPGFFNDLVQGGAFAEQLAEGDFSLVTGADHEEWGKLYNSVAVMRGSTENHALHPKIRLVPFGEFIPFRKEVPLFETMLGDLIPMDFTPGTSLDPLQVTGQPFSIVPLVCFEDTIGDHARKFIRAEPQVIVNVTNDNWFHQSPATEMHFANARWRSAELHRTLLRSANTGVTAIVSPQGGVQRLPSFQARALSGWFHAGDSRITFYARHGDLFSQAAGALSALGCGVVWRRRRHPVLRAPFTS